MQYRKIDHSCSRFLAEIIFAIYELNSSGEESTYKTIPCGIIGCDTGETVKLIENGNVYYSGFEFSKAK